MLRKVNELKNICDDYVKRLRTHIHKESQRVGGGGEEKHNLFYRSFLIKHMFFATNIESSSSSHRTEKQ